MKIDKVITMASRSVRLPFLVMERSLRGVGCDLPLMVIPYGDDLFELPPNAEWWPSPKFSDWLRKNNAHPTMAKYRCLTQENYAYFDTDILMLDDFRKVLEPHQNFVVADTEWSKPFCNYTPDSALILSQRSSLWKLRNFNTGHFCCDRALYTEDEVMGISEKPEYRSTCLEYPLHEQPGINLLVALSNVEVTNLSLPPYKMESTMAVDYLGEWEALWQSGQRPYFIHYAGSVLLDKLPINRLFYDFLTKEEQAEWDATVAKKMRESLWRENWPLPVKLVNRMLRLVDSRFHVAPNS